MYNSIFIYLELQRNVEEPLVLCVVGNKTDLEENRKVSREEALEYTSSIGGTYYEASALHDRGTVAQSLSYLCKYHHL